MNNICIVGAGKIAYSLTKALLDAGYNVCTVFSRRKDSAEKLASRFKLSCCTDNISEVPVNTALFFLAVPDSEIESVARKLAEAELQFENTIFAHLSGSQDVGLLKALKDKGASVASFHIMQTFPSYEVVDIKAHYAAIETSDADTEQFLFSLARRLLLKPFPISSEHKTYYHLTGVFASNFLIANIFNAAKIFEKSKIPEVSFWEIAKPIIESTINNIDKYGIADALSGPVVRGDLETVRKHVGTLLEDGNVKNNFLQEKSLALNYLMCSITLLSVINNSAGKLTDKQKEIYDFIEEMIREIIKK